MQSDKTIIINANAQPKRSKRKVFLLVLIMFVWLGWSALYVSWFRDKGNTATSRLMHQRHIAAQHAGIGPHQHDNGGPPDLVGNVSQASPLSNSREASEIVPVASAEEALYATLHTDHGPIHWQLHQNEAPKTVENIVRMARLGVFNDSCFYRYEKGFVLQGGLHCNKRKTHIKGAKNVPLEYKIPNGKLTVALARAGSDLHSGGTEFFINLADNSKGLGPSKKGGYAVFATVIGAESLETMQALKKLKTKKKGLTVFVDPQPIIFFIEISHAMPEGAKR